MSLPVPTKRRAREPAEQGLSIHKRIKKDGALPMLAPITRLVTQTAGSLNVGSLVLLFNIRDPRSGAVLTEKMDRGIVAACSYAAETKAWCYTVLKCPRVRPSKAALTDELFDGGRWFGECEVECVDEVDAWTTTVGGYMPKPRRKNVVKGMGKEESKKG